MNALLQEHEAKRIFPLPEGLRELASDISREVLRSQPENIYGFIADYCEALLRARNAALGAARVVGDMIDHDVTFQNILIQRGVPIEEAERASIIIQAAFRGFYTRRSLKDQGLEVDPMLRKLGVDRKTAERAITRVQAAFRGYMVRKILKEHEFGEMQYEREPSHSEIITKLLKKVNWETATDAAVKIQAMFRGFSIRKSLEDALYGEIRQQVWQKQRQPQSPKPSISLTEMEPRDYQIVEGKDIIEMSTDEEMGAEKSKSVVEEVFDEMLEDVVEDGFDEMLEDVVEDGFDEMLEDVVEDDFEQAEGSENELSTEKELSQSDMVKLLEEQMDKHMNWD